MNLDQNIQLIIKFFTTLQSVATLAIFKNVVQFWNG